MANGKDKAVFTSSPVRDPELCSVVASMASGGGSHPVLPEERDRLARHAAERRRRRLVLGADNRFAICRELSW